MGLSSLHILSRRALRWEMRGSLFIEKLPPKKCRKFFGTGPHWGIKPSPQGTGPHSFPVKPSEIPVNRLSPSKGYNPSTEPNQALKSARFSCPLSSDICADLYPT